MNKSTINNDTEKRAELAKRIFEYLPTWERDYTPEEIAENIAQNPLETIAFLLDELSAYK